MKVRGFNRRRVIEAFALLLILVVAASRWISAPARADDDNGGAGRPPGTQDQQSLRRDARERWPAAGTSDPFLGGSGIVS